MAVVAAALTTAGPVPGQGPAALRTPAPPAQLLPDLQQELPTRLSVIETASPRGGRAYRLGFRSAAYNTGPGVLTVHGRRRSTRVPTMTADQIVNLTDGTTTTLRGAGTLRYNRSADHAHWHLLGFERYELRSADDTLVRRDRKASVGFCLGDRYLVGIEPPQPPHRSFDENCGRDRPELLSLFTGISIMWADDYAPHLEGQNIDVTGLPAGAYQLVHRVNPTRGLAETSYANNASSLLVRLTYPDGRSRAPRVRSVKRCPGSARCR